MPAPIGTTRQTARPTISPSAERAARRDARLPDRLAIERQARHLRAQAMARLCHLLRRTGLAVLRRAAAHLPRMARREADRPSHNLHLPEAP
jgi:hypothetical protein